MVKQESSGGDGQLPTEEAASRRRRQQQEERINHASGGELSSSSTANNSGGNHNAGASSSGRTRSCIANPDSALPLDYALAYPLTHQPVSHQLDELARVDTEARTSDQQQQHQQDRFQEQGVQELQPADGSRRLRLLEILHRALQISREDGDDDDEQHQRPGAASSSGGRDSSSSRGRHSEAQQ